MPHYGAGYYFTGDGAHRTEGGYYQITGRMDDVINISGHRLGTAEIEDAMVSSACLLLTGVLMMPLLISESGWDCTPQVTSGPFVLCCAQADHPAVPETAVIGYPHDIKGEGECPLLSTVEGHAQQGAQ